MSISDFLSGETPAPGAEHLDAPSWGGARARDTRGARVLVIDDEPEIQRAVGQRLRGEGFAVEGALTAREGIDLVGRWHPDVLLLDLTLPDADGLDVCRSLRAWTSVPILVLSVRANDADKVTALELGADDYLTKPFSSSELVARVRVALRHSAHAASVNSGQANSARFQTGDLVLDFERRSVTMAGAEVHLTPTEYEMLKYLAMNAGKVITHRTLLHAVWGPQYDDTSQYLRVFIRQLRRKIEPEPSRPRYLLTEPGIGYRLRASE